MSDVTPTPLNDKALPELATAGRVAVPDYERNGLVAGIVHFGVGGFHRAHQAMVIDQLLRQGVARDWAICGVGVLQQDRRMHEVMQAQDGLYTLVLQHPDGHHEARVIGSIIDYLFAPDDPEAVIERMATPEVRIVSLTVTEGGYNFDQVTGAFDATNADVRHDLRPGAAPSTVFAFVAAALARRRERGIPPFTVLSCDNIPGNGEVARRMFTSYARLAADGLGQPDLADWMEAEVRFPSTMVDRITPVTLDENRAEVRDRFGVEDAWPVVAEPFFQWVVEDAFQPGPGGGRPPFERTETQLVDDVEPYELMKLRLLNCSHQALAYVGYLSGYRYAHEATDDPAIQRFVRRYMDEEAQPTLLPVPGIDLEGYKATLIERFANPEVRDTLARLAAEASDRIPKWLLPVVRENLAAGRQLRMSALIVAGWTRYAEGIDEQGEPITVVDRLADEVVAAARRYPEDPLAFLRNRLLFGDLAEQEAFATVYRDLLDDLHRAGAHATVTAVSAS